MNTVNKTALVIGGSGMLAEASLTLAGEYEVVGVLGRTKHMMENVLGGGNMSANIVPIYADYSDSDAFDIDLDKFTREHGKAELILSWIHSTSPDAIAIAAKYCTGNFYEVTARKHAATCTHKSQVEALGVNHHHIVLGSIGDRWLTDSEISRGTLTAIKQAHSTYTIGDK